MDAVSIVCQKECNYSCMLTISSTMDPLFLHLASSTRDTPYLHLANLILLTITTTLKHYNWLKTHLESI